MNPYHAVDLNPVELAVIDFTNAMYDDKVFSLIAKEEIRDALSSGQLISKKWLLDVCEHKLGLEFVCDDHPEVPIIVVGGWVGLLAQSLNHLRDCITADTLDINADTTRIARQVLTHHPRARAITGDMHDFDYSPYQVVVNTAAEHIPDVKAWSNKIPKGTTLIVQSNDARHVAEHVSCVDSAWELADLLDLETVTYAEFLTFSMYTRFMVIGKK
jgi:hypothetical protein